MSDTPTHAQHFVWTYDDSDAHLDRNAGIPDLLLTSGMDQRSADALAKRLAQRYPADTFETRDMHGDHVRTYGTVRKALARPLRLPERPARRRLGTR